MVAIAEKRPKAYKQSIIENRLSIIRRLKSNFYMAAIVFKTKISISILLHASVHASDQIPRSGLFPAVHLQSD